MVWITKNAAFLARYTKSGSLMVIVMMFSMNSSIEDSFESVSTASVSSVTSGFDSNRYSSMCSKRMCCDLMSISYHDVSMRRSFPIYIVVSLVVVHSYISVTVTNGNHRHRKDMFPQLLCMLM